MARGNVFDYGRPGRPKVPVKSEPPKYISRLNALMMHLDDRGWYRELAKRQRREYLKANAPFIGGRPIGDPLEMDRIMCRSDAVVEWKDETDTDLNAAQFTGHIVLEIDPNCPNSLLFKLINAILDQTRKRHARRINTKHWAQHRILALYELKLRGYDLSQDRKQLAQWLFPKISSQKVQGDKFDRAKQYLNEAKDQLPALRAQLNS
jgi:hypothetical protein